MFFARVAKFPRPARLAFAGAALAAGMLALPGPARACDAGEVRGLISRGFTDAEIDRHCAVADAQAMAAAIAAAQSVAEPALPPAAPPSGTAPAACPPAALLGDWTAEELPETSGGGVGVARLAARAVWRIGGEARGEDGAEAGGATLARAPRRWPFQTEPVPVRLAQSRCEADVLTLVWDETTETGPARMVVRLIAPEPGAQGGALSDTQAGTQAEEEDDAGPGQAELAWGEYLRERPAGVSTAATREFGRMRLDRIAAVVPNADPPSPAEGVSGAGAPPRPGLARLPTIERPAGAGGLTGLPGFDATQARTPAAARERLTQLRAARDMCKASFVKAMGTGGRDMCGAFDATIADLEKISGL